MTTFGNRDAHCVQTESSWGGMQGVTQNCAGQQRPELKDTPEFSHTSVILQANIEAQNPEA